ncbi:MAG TPA: circularly permuted type 2 ATP-grasp protein [Alphaproteobacteria bacterium]|nr:circularly permuted type 2 ATP-grasp protein [Alphaproteobacteria bacterium]
MNETRFFDEMAGAVGNSYDESAYSEADIREAYRAVRAWLETLSPRQRNAKRKEAETLFRRMGITFLVYGTGESTERLIPFDIIPRVLTAEEWGLIERGCLQRVRAINTFLSDIYHDQEIIKAGTIPAAQVFSHPRYRAEMIGVDVPGNTYIHITGIDLVRTGESEFYVLEDNLRNPSGVSYMLENREVMMRLFPDLFTGNRIAPVIDYPESLLRNLRAVAPAGVELPTVALLTPGIYNSAYFEHVFLADEMGIQLVEGKDLFVKGDRVFMHTTHGPERVDVIYRRIDDDFLDPLAFNPDSLLGVPGLLAAYRAGGVTLANAIGTGVADDKAMYTYVPEMIRFYLGEEPILANVPTYSLGKDEDRAYVMEHLDELVVKEVGGAGGYGMLVGPAATQEEIAAYRERILGDPANFIAQPTLSLSTCPTFTEAGIAPRHVDLRPFVLSGTTQTVVPGGLTRVALREGSLVVNSSQGGGTKDTWVLRGQGAPS